MAIENIILHENAQFFKKDRNEFYSKNRIRQIFTTASEGRKGQYLLNHHNYHFEDLLGVQFSICVFKRVQPPSFLDVPLEGWEEQKLAYLLIIDYKDYVVIFKKNILGIDDVLYHGLTEINYRVLSTIFVHNETNIEKISLNNTSTLPNSMKTKIYEAENLKDSLPTYGVAKYVPNTLRLNNNSEKTSVTFNTSRVNNYGDKRYIYELITWGADVIQKIDNYVVRNTFIDVFAEPIEYSDFANELRPISILVNTSKIHTDIENHSISHFAIQKDDIIKHIPTKKVLEALKQVFPIISQVIGEDEVFTLETSLTEDIEVNINRKSITLKSKKASKILIFFDDGSYTPLINYLNSYNDYTINFENLDLIYYHKKLFKDSNLLNTVNAFLNVFAGIPILERSTSEKGDFTEESTGFTERSLFNYIDTIVIGTSQYSFLDDLGDEWGDFIMLNENRLSFIHAKHGTSRMSASAFQEVVGQALKNIGNFNPTIDRIDGHKRRSWSSVYSIDDVRTRINRLRIGDNLDNGISTYKTLLLNPNVKREIILVIDFISKENLQRNLERLQNAEAFAERNQVIQILWIISGLINCCIENGIDIYIHCRP